jgi:hypothetical protein
MGGRFAGNDVFSMVRLTARSQGCERVPRPRSQRSERMVERVHCTSDVRRILHYRLVCSIATSAGRAPRLTEPDCRPRVQPFPGWTVGAVFLESIDR